MPTRQRTQHNIRPRVLSAVLNLQKFTVQELVTAANLRDRKQAYAQLDILKNDDLISGETMAPDRANRPPTLYEVKPKKIAEIAKILEGYGLSSVQHDRKERNAALDRARNLLTEIEGHLSAIKPTQLTRAAVEDTALSLESTSKQLDDVDLELETARLESERNGEGDIEISQTALRVEESRKSFRGLEKALRVRRTVNWLTKVVKDWTANKPCSVEEARKLLQRTEGKLATEIVLDLLSPAFHNHELMPALLASQALRTNDLNLISLCLMRLSRETSTWWRYNLLNTEFLQGRFEEAYGKWPEIFLEVAKSAQCTVVRNRATGIYVYEPRKMSRERLLPLLKKYEVSIVSPHTLDFWTLNEEIVRPLLVDPVSEARNEAGPLTSTVTLSHSEESGPLWILYAYGPLTEAIRQWPGAPPLRVAASVDCLRPENIDVPRIANALREEKGVVVLETREINDHHIFRADVETALGEVDEIGSFAGA